MRTTRCRQGDVLSRSPSLGRVTAAERRRRSLIARPFAPRKTGLDDALDSHPHHCQAGHHWHHAGPTAELCELPTGYTESDQPLRIRTDECPLCTGRAELLIRGPHEHHCPVCRGNWQHEGACPEAPVAWCPWCIPASGEPPAPGARQGRHFHTCPKCTRSWEHTKPCAAPLRIQMAEHARCRQANRLAARRAVARRRAGGPARAWVAASCVLLLLGFLLVGLALWLSPSGPRRPLVARDPSADAASTEITSRSPTADAQEVIGHGDPAPSARQAPRGVATQLAPVPSSRPPGPDGPASAHGAIEPPRGTDTGGGPLEMGSRRRSADPQLPPRPVPSQVPKPPPPPVPPPVPPPLLPEWRAAAPLPARDVPAESPPGAAGGAVAPAAPSVP
jgi:hypothetical protein